MYNGITNRLGFAFALTEHDDGTLYVRVVDLWDKRLDTDLKQVQELVISLTPYASYSDAKDLADYLNRLMRGISPIKVSRFPVKEEEYDAIERSLQFPLLTQISAD